MYDEHMKTLVPEDLVGKEDILFCNIDDLCKFHGDRFLPELSSYIFDVGKVADLFVKQVCWFALYPEFAVLSNLAIPYVYVCFTWNIYNFGN